MQGSNTVDDIVITEKTPPQDESLNPTRAAELVMTPGTGQGEHPYQPPSARSAWTNISQPNFNLSKGFLSRLKSCVSPYINSRRLLGAIFATITVEDLLVIAGLLLDFHNEKNGGNLRLSLVEFTHGDKIFLVSTAAAAIMTPFIFLLLLRCCCGVARPQPKGIIKEGRDGNSAFLEGDDATFSASSMVSNHPNANDETSNAKANLLAASRAILFAGFLVSGLVSLVLGITGLLQENKDIKLNSGFTFSDWRFDVIFGLLTSLLFLALVSGFSWGDRAMQLYINPHEPRPKSFCC